jgi:hypothetical protein
MKTYYFIIPLLFKFFRRRVIQVYAKGARVLDGSFMTQELNFITHTSESSLSSEPLAAYASIADPYVLLKMVDGTIWLLVGGMVHPLIFLFRPLFCGHV